MQQDRYSWTKTLAAFLATSLLNGCLALLPQRPSVSMEKSVTSLPPRLSSGSSPSEAKEKATIRQTSSELTSGDLFADLSELSVNAVVEQVLARNPSLEQMRAVWQTALARYPQVIALDDPMFAAVVGPGSLGSNQVDFAYRVEASQKFPWHGKRDLRGQEALAQAGAAERDVEDMRLQLIESAKSAYFDYFLVVRATEVNAESLRLLQEFRQNAESRYKTGLATQQDVLQADVEVGRQKERRLELDQQTQVARARLNTLLHVSPDMPLPPPPRELVQISILGDLPTLRQRALERRPDLQALVQRLAAEEAALGLAFKEKKPDVEVMAAWDSFWQEKPLRTMVGMRMNLPVQLGRRDGMVLEAQSKIAQRRAELARLTDQVNFQVQEAYTQVDKSTRILTLYNKTILPAAEANVKAAQSAYVTGKVPFLSLLEAQRNLAMLHERHFEAAAAVQKHRATIERVTGGSD